MANHRTIPERYFNELISLGHTVPRYESTGEVISFSVGSEYTIKCASTKRLIKVKCTQSCPHHLKVIGD